MSYDQQNLPLTLTSTGTTTTYRYDHAGQRIAKQVGAGNTELYLLEGAATLGVVTVNGAGSAVSWHVTLLAGDKVVGRQPNVGNRKYYHTDLLGSTRAVAEGTTVVESYDFDPWGRLMPGRTLGGGTKEGFTSKERDLESGLDYFGARYYMAALARWTAVDPMSDSLLAWSPYNYVFNNPAFLTDPDGRCPPERTGRPCVNILGGSPMRVRTEAVNPEIGKFGMVRNGGSRAHQGVDFLAEKGSSVTAADRGTITLGEYERLGNYALITHRNDDGDVVSFTLYAHMEKFADVSSGEQVEAGQEIGYGGNTGNAKGLPTHVHFEIWKTESPGLGRRGLDNRVDPLKAFGSTCGERCQ